MSNNDANPRTPPEEEEVVDPIATFLSSRDGQWVTDLYARTLSTAASGAIDGDALLLHVLQSPLLDEHPAGQTLPVIFLFQEYMARLCHDVGANVAVFFVKQRVPLWVGAARTVRLVLPTYLRLCGTYPAHEVDSLDNLGGARHRYLITYFGSQVPSNCGWRPTQGVGVGANPEPATELLRRSILTMAGAVHGQGGTHLVDLPTLTMHGGVGVSAWVTSRTSEHRDSEALRDAFNQVWTDPQWETCAAEMQPAPEAAAPPSVQGILEAALAHLDQDQSNAVKILLPIVKTLQPCPPECRAFVVPTLSELAEFEDASPLREFNTFWSAYVRAVNEQLCRVLESAPDAVTPEIARDLCDLLDRRHVLAHVTRQVGPPELWRTLQERAAALTATAEASAAAVDTDLLASTYAHDTLGVDLLLEYGHDAAAAARAVQDHDEMLRAKKQEAEEAKQQLAEAEQLVKELQKSVAARAEELKEDGKDDWELPSPIPSGQGALIHAENDVEQKRLAAGLLATEVEMLMKEEAKKEDQKPPSLPHTTHWAARGKDHKDVWVSFEEVGGCYEHDTFLAKCKTCEKRAATHRRAQQLNSAYWEQRVKIYRKTARIKQVSVPKIEPESRPSSVIDNDPTSPSDEVPTNTPTDNRPTKRSSMSDDECRSDGDIRKLKTKLDTHKATLAELTKTAAHRVGKLDGVVPERPISMGHDKLLRNLAEFTDRVDRTRPVDASKLQDPNLKGQQRIEKIGEWHHELALLRIDVREQIVQLRDLVAADAAFVVELRLSRLPGCASEPERAHHTGAIYRHIVDCGRFERSVLENISDDEQLPQNTKHVAVFRKALEHLGVPLLHDAPPSWNLQVPGSATYNAAEFALTNMPHLLDRPSGKWDPRTALLGGFKPEEWQAKLLDAIEARQPVLVHAPTSAGKTFVCYYAMLQILQSRGDDMVAYVCPTYALTEQVFLEARARFGDDKVALIQGNAVVGNPLECSILVTTIGYLETRMVLSGGAQAQDAFDRLKWVIMDEVHNITSEDGARWESVMHTLDCPFIGLSASIGNPEVFGRWAQALTHRKGQTLVSIPAEGDSPILRYNDLKLWGWCNDGGWRFSPLSIGHVVDVDELVRTGELPPRLSLLPEDCFGLFQGLVQALSSHEHLCSVLQSELEASSANPLLAWLLPSDSESPRPDETVFSTKAVNDLKEVVLRLIRLAARQDPDIVRAVLNAARDGSTATMKSLWRDRLVQTTVDCVTSLKWSRDSPLEPGFPAIVFRLDTDECEKMADEIVKHLETSQARSECIKVVKASNLGEREETRIAADMLRNAGALEANVSPWIWDAKVYPASIEPLGTVEEVLRHRLDLGDAAREEVLDRVKCDLCKKGSDNKLIPKDDEKAKVRAAVRELASAGVLDGRDRSWAWAQKVYDPCHVPVGTVQEVLCRHFNASQGQDGADLEDGHDSRVDPAFSLTQKEISFKEYLDACGIVLREKKGTDKTSPLKAGQSAGQTVKSALQDAQRDAKDKSQGERDAERAGRLADGEYKERPKKWSCHKHRSVGFVSTCDDCEEQAMKQCEKGVGFGDSAGQVDADKETEKAEPLWKWIRRGVAVHHASMPARYRRGVEQLLQEGRLGAVISTETLAQGINVPCRTVVVAGSTSLSPQMCHQLMGRAGRRGHDSRGHVVFLGASEDEVKVLLGEPLEKATGHCAAGLTAYGLIRRVMRCHGRGTRDGSEAAWARRCSTAAAREFHGLRAATSDANFGGGDLSVVKHHSLFLTDYLKGRGFVQVVKGTPQWREAVNNCATADLCDTPMPPEDEAGGQEGGEDGGAAEAPRDPPAPVCGTHKLEPTPKGEMVHQLPRFKANAVYLAEAMFESSLFTDIAEKYFVPGDRLADGNLGLDGLKTNHFAKIGLYPSAAFEEILTLLSFFVFREHVPADSPDTDGKGHPITLKVPEAAIAFAEQIERDAVDRFSAYAGAFCQRHGAAVSPNRLPAERPKEAEAVDLGLAPDAPLSEIQFRTHVRSPYLAMCGRGDSFESRDDLLTSTIQTARFDRVLIPSLELRSGLGVSAWLLDFFSNRGSFGACHAHLRGKTEGKSVYGVFDRVSHDLKVIRNVLARRCKEPSAFKDPCEKHSVPDAQGRVGHLATCKKCKAASLKPCGKRKPIERHTTFHEKCHDCIDRNTPDWAVANPEKAKECGKEDDEKYRDVLDGTYKLAVLFERLSQEFDEIKKKRFPWHKK